MKGLVGQSERLLSRGNLRSEEAAKQHHHHPTCLGQARHEGALFESCLGFFLFLAVVTKACPRACRRSR